MRTNSSMRDLLRQAPSREELPPLPDDAQAVLDAGWTVGPEGSLLLRALWNGVLTPLPASTVGRYEYDINDVYIPLADLASDMSNYLSKAALRGASFATEMLLSASEFPASDTLVAMVGIFTDTEDEDFVLQGARLRFFTRRGNYPGWFENLESFELQAVAMINLADAMAQ